MSDLLGKQILLGVTGGVAAYKSVDLASKLSNTCQVRTIMTESACQLVGPKSFEAITGEPVYTTMWQQSSNHDIDHISLVQWADIVVVAPATANIIAKIASGICDDLLSTTLCVCWNKSVLIAPAMNDNMWANPIVQANVTKLKELGFMTVGPEKGRLACGTEGLGRMSEPVDIISAIKDKLS